MRAFRFSLQPLLDWRTRVEEEKQRDFAACRRLVVESADELARLLATRRSCANLLVASARSARGAELRLRDAHLRCLESAIVKERRRGAELHAACDRARERLMTASRERRIIEKLKERRVSALEAENARREELELDESNARRQERAARERLVRRQAEGAMR
jgi:flagellar protein FliJ